MTEFKYLLPGKLFDIIKRCGISSSKQILTKSEWEIKQLTNLKSVDIVLLKDIAAQFRFNGKTLPGNYITNSKYVTTGCPQFDKHLGGGLRCGAITEIFGASGSGKTQLCLFASVCNWKRGAVYICTEDFFPVRRFEQIKKELPDYDSNNDYGSKIYVEHLNEQCELMACVRVRLPKLIATHQPSLIIIDSIAAPFRCDTTNYIQRARDLREISIRLIDIAKKFNVAVICINQVTSSFETIDEQVLPCLGLAWSNVISTRIKLQKTCEQVNIDNDNNCESNYVPLRELDVIFSPCLPNIKLKFIVTSSGVKYI